MEKDCGMWIHLLSHKLKKRMNANVQSLGLTGTQSRIMHYILVKCSDGPVFQRDVESTFGLSRSTATGILQSMEKSGMIVRESVLSDARLKSLIPTETTPCLLLDCGANVDARPSHLVQFARMGSIYMEHVVGVKNPRVAIVNIGAEEEKGNALVKETFPLLKECRDINFIGSIEAREIPAGYADVIVCEAFVGNVIVKLYEGVGATLIKKVKGGMMSSVRSKIGALLVKPALKQTLKEFDLEQYGGAPLLGLKGLVVKTHGSSKAVEIKNTVLQCVTFRKQDIIGKIKESLAAAKEEG